MIDNTIFEYTTGASTLDQLLLPNNNYGYGPYNTLDEAVSELKSLLSKKSVPQGLTVGIKASRGLIEYLIISDVLGKDLTTSDFMLKQSGSALGSDFILIVEDGFHVVDKNNAIILSVSGNTIQIAGTVTSTGGGSLVDPAITGQVSSLQSDMSTVKRVLGDLYPNGQIVVE